MSRLPPLLLDALVISAPGCMDRLVAFELLDEL